jgi:hypothetical protein
MPRTLPELCRSQFDQDLTVYILSQDEVAEVANYPTKTVPTDAQSYQRELSGKEIPGWIKQNFGEFYQAIFQKADEPGSTRFCVVR